MRLPFDPAELAVLEDNGFLGVTDAMKEAIAATLKSRGFTDLTEEALKEACWHCHVDPGNLTEQDIMDICQKGKLNK